MGGGGCDERVQIARRRDGESEDERRRGGRMEEGVCVCELSQRETTRRCVLRQSLHFEAESHGSTGPCTEHHEEVHINYD